MTTAEVTAVLSANNVNTSNVQELTEGEGYNVPTPNLLTAYETGDKRKEASIGMASVVGKNYPFNKKFLHPHTQFNITNYNWPVYCYSEVLLLLAEALNEQGKTSEALSYLNMFHAHS